MPYLFAADTQPVLQAYDTAILLSSTPAEDPMRLTDLKSVMETNTDTLSGQKAVVVCFYFFLPCPLCAFCSAGFPQRVTPCLAEGLAAEALRSATLAQVSHEADDKISFLYSYRGIHTKFFTPRIWTARRLTPHHHSTVASTHVSRAHLHIKYCTALTRFG
jgi:hypothetical protein